MTFELWLKANYPNSIKIADHNIYMDKEIVIKYEQVYTQMIEDEIKAYNVLKNEPSVCKLLSVIYLDDAIVLIKERIYGTQATFDDIDAIRQWIDYLIVTYNKTEDCDENPDNFFWVEGKLVCVDLGDCWFK